MLEHGKTFGLKLLLVIMGWVDRFRLGTGFAIGENWEYKSKGDESWLGMGWQYAGVTSDSEEECNWEGMYGFEDVW